MLCLFNHLLVSFLDVSVLVTGIGEVTVDICYGGAFYAFVSAGKLGCRLGTSSMEELRSAAAKLKGKDRH